MATTESKQVILEVGAERGSITLVGSQSGGSWRFRVETNESALLDLLEEDDWLEIPQRPWVTDWHAALAQLDGYLWFELYPLAPQSALYPMSAASSARSSSV
ncbi:hypothetical protein ACSBOB_33290 [Mesorhizobium sp. ASY16-5R]|uniref:hypothetical protein n=1 Tax=Mesorhizobium sp. ASY16-5R TaxID=3445772 RepID=UPI003F9F30F3